VVNRSLMGAKLGELQMRIDRVGALAKVSSVELAADNDALELVAFNLLLAVQLCADVASHVIADSGWPSARSLSDAFARLAQHAVISASTSTALMRAAGLRNVVAHGYAGLDVERLHAASTSGLTDLRAYASEVAAWVTSQP